MTIMSNNIMHGKGFFICLEGVDGSGKSTTRDWMDQWFKDHGVTPVLTREPGGTPMAEQLRSIILADPRPGEDVLTPMAKTLLFMAARAQHVEQLIKPKLAEGRVVISDRFCDSTFAYQKEEGVPLQTLMDLHQQALGGFYPDLTIVLDGDPEVFRQRMESRGEEQNYYDRASMSFHLKTRELYQQFARNWPERYALINAEVSPEDVHAQLIPVLERVMACA